MRTLGRALIILLVAGSSSASLPERAPYQQNARGAVEEYDARGAVEE